MDADFLINLIENQQKELNNLKEIEKSHKEENGKLRVELEKYKRLAEMNLKDAEEFQKNMCEHRCILYNEIEELKTELFEEKEKNKELEEHQKQFLDGELITAKQGKFFEKMIKENYIRKDKLKAIQGELCMQLRSYVQNEASPEQERIAGGINIINKILEDINEIKRDIQCS